MKRKTGYTLVEILAAVAIIAVLLLVGGRIYSSLKDSMRDKDCRNNLSAIAGAIEFYASRHRGVCPDDLNDLVASGYLDKLPRCYYCQTAEYGYTTAVNAAGFTVFYTVYCSAVHPNGAGPLIGTGK